MLDFGGMGKPSPGSQRTSILKLVTNVKCFYGVETLDGSQRFERNSLSVHPHTYGTHRTQENIVYDYLGASTRRGYI